MKFLKLFLVLVYVLIVYKQPVQAQDSHQGTETLRLYFVEALQTSDVQANGAVFMEIENTGTENDKIIAASSPAAEKVELHTHIMQDDVMMMRPVEFFNLPSGQTVELEPHGDHIMLIGLRAPLVAGSVFPLTITTEKQGDIKVNVMVKAFGEGH